MNIETFWSSMKKDPATGCWNWMRAVGSGGYGQVSYRGSSHGAHRLAWVLAKGPIPAGSGYHGNVVAHRCDNRLCCNPSHLFITDSSGNQVDALHKGRATAAVLTAEQVARIIVEIKEGGTANEIAKRYGVSGLTIRGIATRKTWKSVTGDAGELKFGPRECDPARLRTADYDRIRSMLDSGKTIRQIARECGTTHPTVARVARQSKQAVDTPFKRMNATDRERICDLKRTSGASNHVIAEWLGISQASVSRTLTALGG